MRLAERTWTSPESPISNTKSSTKGLPPFAIQILGKVAKARLVFDAGIAGKTVLDNRPATEVDLILAFFRDTSNYNIKNRVSNLCRVVAVT
jgi:hypothetical protein